MTTSWDAAKYEDRFKTQWMAMIEEKIQHPGAERPVTNNKKPSNVIDLVSMLVESLSATKGAKVKAQPGKSQKPAKQRKAA